MPQDRVTCGIPIGNRLQGILRGANASAIARSGLLPALSRNGRVVPVGE